MPLPLFLGLAAGAAALAGAGTGIHGAAKMVEAKNTMKSASAQHEKNMQKFEKKNKQTTEVMDTLGKKELEILSSFESFSDLIEKIQNRPEFESITINGNVLPGYNGAELRNVSVGACALMSGMGGAALGTAGGFAAAGATTSAVMALGTASTGTAISTLSGAAATNATLAALGGGALSAGGGGIALGTTMLGVTTAGVGLLVGGIIFSIAGSKVSDKADEAYAQMKEAEEQINSICSYLDKLYNTATRYTSTLCQVDEVYRTYLTKLKTIVETNNKTDWLCYSDLEKATVQNTVLLVGLLYKMCKVNLVIKASGKNTLNSVNKHECNEMQEYALEIVSNISETDLPEQDLSTLSEYEMYCVAVSYVTLYFASCENALTSDTRSQIFANLTPLTEKLEADSLAMSVIHDLHIVDSVSFEEMKEALDHVSLEQLRKINDIVITASTQTSSEKENYAKGRFLSYIMSRITSGE